MRRRSAQVARLNGNLGLNAMRHIEPTAKKSCELEIIALAHAHAAELTRAEGRRQSQVDFIRRNECVTAEGRFDNRCHRIDARHLAADRVHCRSRLLQTPKLRLRL